MTLYHEVEGPGSAHLPSLERPADFDALVLAFLADVFPG